MKDAGKMEKIFLTSIQSKTINRFEELEKHNLPRWIFRGQRNHSWTFKSSLERLCESMGLKLLDSHIIEKDIVSEFKRRFHQYSNYIPEKDDNLEWLSIMRHYMVPTRLLDWNYSIYIALYFALECECEDKDGSALWCLNNDWAQEESKEKYLIADKKRNEDVINICDRPSYGQRNEAFTNLFLIEPFIDTAFPISPRHITKRITVQKGLFLCPGNPNHKFIENIRLMNNYEENLKRLLIPKSKRKEFLSKLYQMNITHSTLFPGLDGFAYSLSVYHHSYEIKNLKKSQHRNDNCAWNCNK
jgi:hypothetical protein